MVWNSEPFKEDNLGSNASSLYPGNEVRIYFNLKYIFNMYRSVINIVSIEKQQRINYVYIESLKSENNELKIENEQLVNLNRKLVAEVNKFDMGFVDKKGQTAIISN